jgi:hypothetical protein
MKKILFALASSLAIALSGAGASASFSSMEMQVGAWGFPLSPGMQVLTFNQFDEMGGTRTLKGVQLEIEGDMGALITAENNSTIPANNFAVGLTGIVNVTLGPLAGSLGLLATSPIMPAAATDNGGVPNGSGPDFVNFGLVSDSDSDSDFIAPSAFWIGNSTINANVAGSGGFAAQGSADATINFVDFATKGRVKLIYFFDVIPTPGATALIAVAGLITIRRRRQ